MSILLSCDECTYKDEESCDNDKCKKSIAIHAVQYLEGKCDKHTPPNAEVVMTDLLYFDVMDGVFRYKHRLDCPDCMKQIKKELGI